MMAGMVFGYSYKLSNNNLLLPVVLHGVWNIPGFFFQVYTVWPNIFIYFPDIGQTLAPENIINMIIFAGELLISGIGVLIIALLLWLFGQKINAFGFQSQEEGKTVLNNESR